MSIASLSFPFWLVLLLLVLIMPVLALAGFRLGRYERSLAERSGRTPNYSGDTTLGALLALLGLLLGFTFSATLHWREASASAVVEEAAAITTAFERADLLPNQGGRPLQVALLEYARTRIAPAGTRAHTPSEAAMLARSDTAQAALWPTLLASLDSAKPGPLETFLAGGITEVLDANTRRSAAASKSISPGIWALLIFAAGSGVFLLGNRAGVQGRAPTWRTMVFSLVLSGVLITIEDLDRPSDGLSTVPQASIEAAVSYMQDWLERDYRKLAGSP